MRTSFDAKAVLAEIPHQVAKYVAWTKDLNPRDHSPAQIGKITAKDIASLNDKDVVPAVADAFQRVGKGQPVDASKLIAELTKTLTAEVKRVAGAPGSADAKVLDLDELKEIPAPLRALALRALAYSHTEEFGTFADTTLEFDRLRAAADGVKLPELSKDEVKIATTWLKHHNEETTEVTIPETWKATGAAVPASVVRAQRALKREYGRDYAVTVYRDPKSKTFGVYVASLNGPNVEHLHLFRPSGDKIAHLSLSDDGCVQSDPPFPER
ncbi:MAG: hypothetical protein HY903_20115 [Deltaproteobacteria bacterium]|nr:hypothetical protein [Deltaproteobacteria bacterium]